MILALALASAAFAAEPTKAPTPTATPIAPALPAATVAAPMERVIPSVAQTQLIVLFTQYDAQRASFNNGYVRALEQMGLETTRNDRGEPCWQWDMGRGVFVQTCLTPTPTPKKK